MCWGREWRSPGELGRLMKWVLEPVDVGMGHPGVIIITHRKLHLNIITTTTTHVRPWQQDGGWHYNQSRYSISDLMTALWVHVLFVWESRNLFIVMSPSPNNHNRNSQSIFHRFSNVPLFKSNITNCPNRLSQMHRYNLGFVLKNLFIKSDSILLP